MQGFFRFGSYSAAMRLALLLTLFTSVAVAAGPAYDAELAKKLGADDRGMRMYVLCILKTGPKHAEIKGKQRQEIFAGHFANIQRLADQVSGWFVPAVVVVAALAFERQA